MMVKYFDASRCVQAAANQLLLAAWANDCHGQNWHLTDAIEHLTLTADALGYDMIKRQPEVPAEPVTTRTDAAVRDVRAALAYLTGEQV